MTTVQKTSPGLSFIVPAYNEELGIEATLERLEKTLSSLNISSELIIVNDGSTDRTREIAESRADIRVINHPINTGYGSAIKTGIRVAKYDWIGIADADGTYDIENLPKLVASMEQGYEMVIAARENVLDRDKRVKRLSRRLLIKFLSVFVHANIRDPNSGFRIFSRQLALSFFPFLCNTFSFTTSLTIFFQGEGYFVDHIYLHYAERKGESKVRTIRDSIRLVQLVLQGVTYFNPLKFFVGMAFLILTVVGIPSLGLVVSGYSELGFLYLSIGCAAALVASLGMLADILRPTVFEDSYNPDRFRSDSGSATD